MLLFARRKNLYKRLYNDKISRCIICFEPITSEIISPLVETSIPSLQVQRCENCGFIFAPTNRHEYVDETSFSHDSVPSADTTTSAGTNIELRPSRAGSSAKTGREYALGMDSLKWFKGVNNHIPNILIFGVGLSRDHSHLRKSGQFSSVFVTDLINAQKTSHFVPMNRLNKYDIVIASEVVEHFTNPAEELLNLLSLTTKKGILVITTNINDNKLPLSKSAYLFTKGHTSYWSPHALARMADLAGYKIDFRPLDGWQKQLGPRKRCIIFFKNSEYYREVALFSGLNPVIHSEFS